MMLHDDRPVAAWLSRHLPKPEHRRSLQAYRLVIIPDRWESALQAWGTTSARCKISPAVIVAIMPDDMLAEFVQLVDPIPVIRPKQMFADVNHWTGKWERVGAALVPTYSLWTPETSTIA